MRDTPHVQISLDAIRLFALIAVALIPWAAAIAIALFIAALIDRGYCGR